MKKKNRQIIDTKKHLLELTWDEKRIPRRIQVDLIPGWVVRSVPLRQRQQVETKTTNEQ